MITPTDERIAEFRLYLKEQREQKAQRESELLALRSEWKDLAEKCRRVLAPIKPADDSTRAANNFLFTAQRSVNATELPSAHLIYFLFRELLGYKDLGRFEKLAWSIPVDLDGHAYLIEHRKFGVGIFTQRGTADEIAGARLMADRVKRAIRIAKPFFEWKAEKGVAASKFNVSNNSAHLFERFAYLKELYENISAEAVRRKDEKMVKPLGKTGTSIEFPYYALAQKARWLAMAAVDAFFSWTEHVFIHLAIMHGRITTGENFSKSVVGEWSDKFKLALDIADDAAMRLHYEKLLDLKRRLRNFVAHGAFGQNGEALHFHSSAGAVPVFFDAGGPKARFSLDEDLSFDDENALKTIDTFIAYLWSGSRVPARMYIQDGHMPLILTLAHDGTYAKALASEDGMRRLLDHLGNEWANAANMDW